MKISVILKDNDRIGADIGGHAEVKDIAPSELVEHLLHDLSKRVAEIYSLADDIGKPKDKAEETGNE